MFAVGTEECVLLTFEVREPLVRGAGKKKKLHKGTVKYPFLSSCEIMGPSFEEAGGAGHWIVNVNIYV